MAIERAVVGRRRFADKFYDFLRVNIYERLFLNHFQAMYMQMEAVKARSRYIIAVVSKNERIARNSNVMSVEKRFTFTAPFV